MKSETDKDVFFWRAEGQECRKKDIKDDQLGSGIGLRVTHLLKNCQQHPSWMVGLLWL